MQQPVDLIITARWLVPVDPVDAVLEDHGVAVQDGRIVAVGRNPELLERFRPAQVVDLPHQAMLPGLVNAHGHVPMTLLRGYADDHALDSWLHEHIWPAEARWVGEAFVRSGTRLAIAEMLRSGTTCFADMYFFPGVTAEVVVETGIRAQLALPVLEFPSTWARDPDEYLAKGLEVRDRFASSLRLGFAFGPHAPYSTSDATLARIATLAAELDAPVHMHVHETAGEIEQSLAGFGVRPLARLEALGLLSPRFQAVHMAHASSADIDTLARNGAHAVTCPGSNLKLAAGLCPIAALRSAGVNVAIGTDGAASNNHLDMFAETRLASLLAKAVSGDPCALSARTALRMATLGGAEALGLADQIGSIRPGKCADLVAVDIERIESMPTHDVHSSLVYTGSGASVTHAWVDGRLLLAERALQTLSHDTLIAEARNWRQRMQPH